MKLRFRFVASLALLTAACSSNEDLGSSESQVTVCGKTTVKGIDVYHGDNGGKTIDWTKVKGAGISFAFVKATESTNFVDSSFATNWAGLKAAGLVRGAYHFFHSDVDPTQQATFFLSTVGAVADGDLLVLDLESANGQSQATIEAHAATFMAAVHSASGITPILYTSPAFLSSYTSLAQYPLWVANYGVSCPTVPSAWKTYTFWQSTGSGSLSVINGALDLDTFNGTAADLIAFANGTGPASDAGAAGDASTEDASNAGDASTASDANASNDASTPKNDAGDAEGNVSTEGGCSASPTRTRGASSLAWLVGLVVVVGRLARRRRK